MFSWGRRRAAKRYANELGPQLINDYGASETYTAGQIRSAVARLELPEKYLCFGFAGFMDEAGYNTQLRDLRKAPPYAMARKLFQRYVPVRGFSEPAPARVSPYIHTGSSIR